MKKAISFAMAALMVSSMATVSASATDITIFNSKSEIQEYMVELAELYSEQTGVGVDVNYSQDTVAAHLATRYAAQNPYTINMVDAKDVYTLGAEYGADMTGAEWIDNTNYAISVDGKVIGYPSCVEARGLLYNKDAIEAITGEEFDPSTITTLDEFKAFLDVLVEGGMETPTAILKPDWSLAAHFLQQVYEERPNVGEFIDGLYAGEVDLMADEKFNALMDFFDVMKEYNYFADSPLTAEDELVHMVTSEGEVAFQFGGCWEWNDIIDYEYTGFEGKGIGMMAIPQNVQDDYTGCLVGGGSKYFYIDCSENTSEEQIEAAKDFLEWLTASEEGQTFTSEICGMVSAFNNNDIPCNNDLGAAVKEFVNDGKLVPNFDYDPDDHYSKLGASMQKYLGGEIDRQGLADEVTAYWSTVTPVAHN